MRIGARYVGGVLATGFDALVNRRANEMTWPRGSSRYTLATLAELRVFSPLRYRLVLDGQVREQEAMLVAVGNTGSYGGGMRICPQADPFDGQLDVTIIHPVGRLKLLRLLPEMFSGKFARDACVEQLRVSEVTVEGMGLVGFGDGELIAAAPLTACVVPGADPGLRARPMTVDEPTADEPTPAEAYARFRTRQGSPALTAFADGYGFAFDDYQREACAHVEGGSGVLVAAPTGAGKTIVGEFAVFLALAQGRKCFYTTPIKALSNQKYADLVRRHGPAQVGLLTGDSTINSEAPVVVMTTEVLRNMIYARSVDPGQPRLRGDGRGALPGRPVPRCGLGGGDHRAGRVHPGDRLVGDGEQRRGVR